MQLLYAFVGKKGNVIFRLPSGKIAFPIKGWNPEPNREYKVDVVKELDRYAIVAPHKHAWGKAVYIYDSSDNEVKVCRQCLVCGEKECKVVEEGPSGIANLHEYFTKELAWLKMIIRKYPFSEDNKNDVLHEIKYIEGKLTAMENALRCANNQPDPLKVETIANKYKYLKNKIVELENKYKEIRRNAILYIKDHLGKLYIPVSYVDEIREGDIHKYTIIAKDKDTGNIKKFFVKCESYTEEEWGRISRDVVCYMRDKNGEYAEKVEDEEAKRKSKQIAELINKYKQAILNVIPEKIAKIAYLVPEKTSSYNGYNYICFKDGTVIQDSPFDVLKKGAGYKMLEQFGVPDKIINKAIYIQVNRGLVD